MREIGAYPYVTAATRGTGPRNPAETLPLARPDGPALRMRAETAVAGGQNVI